MRLKQKVDMVIDSLLIILGIILLLLPSFGINDVKFLFFGVMLFYAFLNLVQFILTRKSRDYEGLYTMIISLGKLY